MLCKVGYRKIPVSYFFLPDSSYSENLSEFSGKNKCSSADCTLLGKSMAGEMSVLRLSVQMPVKPLWEPAEREKNRLCGGAGRE